MSEENTHFRLKLGGAEVEYEGREQFLRDEVMPTIVAKIFDLAEKRSDLREPSDLRVIEAAKEAVPAKSISDRKFDHSTGSIAAILGAKKAVDLALAAAAHLTLVRGQESFTRQELLGAMRSAAAFYKKSDASNLSSTLQSLVKSGQIREGHNGNYALNANIRSELEQKLANAG